MEEPVGRREQIADAGIRLIAAGGAHRLTHRLVDTEAELPQGSTSYYARTRRDLVSLIVQRLSDGSLADIEDVDVPASLDLDEATLLIASVIQRMQKRSKAQAARFALMFEVRDDEKLRAALTSRAPVRAELQATAARLLTALGVPDGDRQATELVALVDALLMYQAVDAAPVDGARVVRTYLAGLTRN